MNRSRKPAICRMATRGVALSLLWILWGAAMATGEAPSDWPGVARQISSPLSHAAKAYEANDPEGAKALLSEAYVGPFEEGGMETAIPCEISAGRARGLEQLFGVFRQAMGSGESVGRRRERIRVLVQALEQDARELVCLGVTEVRLAEKEGRPPASAEARPPAPRPEVQAAGSPGALAGNPRAHPRGHRGRPERRPLPERRLRLQTGPRAPAARAPFLPSSNAITWCRAARRSGTSLASE